MLITYNLWGVLKKKCSSHAKEDLSLDTFSLKTITQIGVQEYLSLDILFWNIANKWQWETIPRLSSTFLCEIYTLFIITSNSDPRITSAFSPNSDWIAA